MKMRVVLLVGFTIWVVGWLWMGFHKSMAADEASGLKARLEKTLPGFTVLTVKAVAEGAFWEVTAQTPKGFQVVYTDAQGDVVIVGEAFSLVTFENLTKPVKGEYVRNIIVDFPEEALLRIGATDRPVEVVYFSDPDCSYCRQMHGEVEKLKEAGVGMGVAFLVAERLHPDGRRKARAIWCAENPDHAFDLVMKGSPIEDPPQECGTPNFTQVQTLAETLSIRGTPSFVLTNGKVLAGVTRAEAVLAHLRGPGKQEKGRGVQ